MTLLNVQHNHVFLKNVLEKGSSAINPDWSISYYNIKDNIITVIILL